MEIKFYKYQGTGNDFILIDAISNPEILGMVNSHLVANMCHRRFGIGGDGLMILDNSDLVDFKMIYYNGDGGLSSMCGNGGRCISKLAFDLGYIDTHATFEAVDGMHRVQIMESIVELGMNDVYAVEEKDDMTFVLNTGSPHFVRFCEKEELNGIVDFGKKIRYSEEFQADGINVNLVHVVDKTVTMTTYERGVEDETFSCGTGVVAAAICMSKKFNVYDTIHINTKGGELSVTFSKKENHYTDIKLIGTASFVFSGIYEC